MNSKPKLVAIVGGSGAGKTWLADRVQEAFPEKTARLALDDFYHDLSALPASCRAQVNFDDPQAIDWRGFESVLRECRAGRRTRIPGYNFATHCRSRQDHPWTPQPLVVVDGLWLLHRPGLRSLFDLTVFLGCPSRLRLERRLARDMIERGRTAQSVRRQFWDTVAPMHERWVRPQGQWADLSFRGPLNQNEVDNVIERISTLL